MTCDGIDCILFTAENCIKRKKQLEKELGSLPASGTVVMHHRNSKSIPYLHYYVDGKTLSKRIHEAEAEQVRQDAERRRFIKEELKAITDFLKRNVRTITLCYERMTARVLRCEKPLPKGSEGDNEYRLEDKIHLSRRKEHMRSRAEVIVANCLYENNLEYRYEQLLKIGGRFYYPDFTVMNPLLGTYTYIEYCGIDSPEYEYKLQKKVNMYRKNNIIEGMNLILIREENNMIDSERIDHIIKNTFTLHRYANVEKWLSERHMRNAE